MAALSGMAPFDSEQSLSRNELGDADCGAGIDWSQGVPGISRYRSQSTKGSGTLLTKVIEGEIIPRLLLAHREARANSTGAPLESLADIGTTEAFAELVLISETTDIVAKVEALRARGISLERIFLDLLAPVARILGSFWDEDRCTFSDVTIGLSRLHQVLHEISRQNLEAQYLPKIRRRAFFAPSPGEQHTFGLSMLEEFFLHAGWETASEHSASTASILNTAAAQDLDVIGFSVGCKEFLAPLSDLIDKTRAISRNRDVTIMVGGRLFLDYPKLASGIRYATVLSDGVHAVQIAETLISQAPRGVRNYGLM